MRSYLVIAMSDGRGGKLYLAYAFGGRCTGYKLISLARLT